jgi:pantoate--beta-alanine ligase
VIVARSVFEVREPLTGWRMAGKTIGFVPTMGALHEGHLSLIRRCRSDCDVTVISIFVNPLQFGPGEDMERYPRQEKDDLTACQAERADLVFIPSPEAMYPRPTKTRVQVSELTEGLCGESRPGHFDGVATVVAKLFHIIQPAAAYFGQKDGQQAAVIQQMVRDLNMPIRIVVCPTVREADGLALSSRNAYLTPIERQRAPALYRSLQRAESLIRQGEHYPPAIVEQMRADLHEAGLVGIDYIAIVDAETMQPCDVLRGRVMVALAVHVGSARLIDNVVVDVPSPAR